MYFRHSKFLLKSFLAALALLCAGVAVAWVGPPAGTPPDNCTTGRTGCDAPINVSNTAQGKAGSLSVGGYLEAVFEGTPTSASFIRSQLKLTSANTAIINNYVVGGINFDSNDTQISPNGTTPATAASIRAIAGGTHSTTNLNTDLVFYTTGLNDAALGAADERMRIDERGAVADAFIYSSDARLKDGVETLGDALNKVLSIRGVEFVWNEKSGSAGKHDVGVIAQEVEKVLPEAVSTGNDGYKAVDYPRLVPLLINAIHEQQAQIDELKARLDALEK